MKVKEFKKFLVGLEDDAEILFSSDEELNTLRKGGEICELTYGSKKLYAIYGFDGTEVEVDEHGKISDD